MKRSQIIFGFLFFCGNALHGMMGSGSRYFILPKDKSVPEKHEEEENTSKVPSLKLLAAKVYTEKNKKLPEMELIIERQIPEDCLDLIKLYLPITKDLAPEQCALAIKFGDKERKIDCGKKMIAFIPTWDYLDYEDNKAMKTLHKQMEEYISDKRLIEKELEFLNEELGCYPQIARCKIFSMWLIGWVVYMFGSTALVNLYLNGTIYPNP